MVREMYTVEEVHQKLANGQNLLLAGDERLLQKLPAGNWIGGTIPYFMTRNGGLTSKELIYVTELPEYIIGCEVKCYNAETISQIYIDAPEHGFSFIIIPAQSQTHFSFALNVPNFEGFAMRPLIAFSLCGGSRIS